MFRSRTLGLALVFSTVASACATSQAPQETAPVPSPPPQPVVAVSQAAAPPPAPVLDAGGAAPERPVTLPEPRFDQITDPAHKQALQVAAAEARSIISSAPFRHHLAAIDLLDAHAKADPTTGRVVAETYLGLDGTAHQHPTVYATTKADPKCKHSTASTARPDSDKTSTTTLRECTIIRALSYPRTKDDPVEAFACAVNTLAHEWTHTIPEANHPREWLYQDDGHKNDPKGLVSYTVGAIAQCVYLDTHGYNVEEKFGDCVKQVGTTFFEPSTCTKIWAEKTFRRR